MSGEGQRIAWTPGPLGARRAQAAPVRRAHGCDVPSAIESPANADTPWQLDAPAENAAPDDRPADPAPRSRPRVLVGAYAISPARGSEPGMGWHICRSLAEWCDLTVLCSPGTPGADRGVHRQEIADWFRDHGPTPGLEFHFVEPPLLSRLCQRERELFRRTVYYAGYAAWQRSAFRQARELHRREPFDLAHQLNITGYREPGHLWRLPIPFLWGPVGGAADVPPAFFPMMSVRDRAFYRLRNLGNAAQKRFAWRCRRAATKAARIWAIGIENQLMVRQAWGREAENLLESGASPRPEARVRQREPGRPLRLVWSGLHIGRKALPILLHALAELGESGKQVEVAILGAGPETEHWKRLAESLGVSPRLRWTGKLTLPAALAEVGSADALAFTSVQEGTPHAVLEALSLGLPVICHDACGMGSAVTSDCGIKTPMIDPRRSVAGFAGAIRALCDGSADLAELSAGALRRSVDLSWRAKARRIADVYEEVLRPAPAPTGPGGGR